MLVKAQQMFQQVIRVKQGIRCQVFVTEPGGCDLRGSVNDLSGLEREDLLAMSLSPHVLAMEICYPVAVEQSEDGAEIRKTYDLAPEEDSWMDFGMYWVS